MPTAAHTTHSARSFETALLAILQPDHPDCTATNTVHQALRSLEEAAPAALDELWWDAVDAAKDHLGAAEANNCGDDEEDQERSIAAAEAWVAERLSPLSPSSSEAAALVVWAFGAQQAQARLAAVATSADSAGRADRPARVTDRRIGATA